MCGAFAYADRIISLGFTAVPMQYNESAVKNAIFDAFSLRANVLDAESFLAFRSHLSLIRPVDISEAIGCTLYGFISTKAYQSQRVADIAALHDTLEFLDGACTVFLTPSMTAEDKRKYENACLYREKQFELITAAQAAAIVEWLRLVQAHGTAISKDDVIQSAISYWNRRSWQ